MSSICFELNLIYVFFCVSSSISVSCLAFSDIRQLSTVCTANSILTSTYITYIISSIEILLAQFENL